jgi:hypothetical protein
MVQSSSPRGQRRKLMKYPVQFLRQILQLFIIVTVFAGVPAGALAKDVHLDATYTLAANGDLDVVMKLTTSMDLYQKMRDSVSNLYLLLRNLSSQRTEMEVENKKADWDDSSRTITISYKALGMARNLGNHWEIDIAQLAEFLNLDEDQKTFYFTEEVASPLGTVTGRGKLLLPAAAQQYKWDGGKRVASYVLPIPKNSSGQRVGLLITAGILFLLGIVLTIASFAGRAAKPVDQLPPPQNLLSQ